MGLMNKFSNWYHGINDIEKEPPKKGAKRILYLAWNFIGKVVLINLIFLLCSIPLLTNPAAFAGLNKYLIKMYRDGYGFDISDFGQEFKNNITKVLPFGIIIGVLLFVAYYFLSLANNFTGTSLQIILQVCGGIVAMAMLIMGEYLFVMNAMVELTRKQLLKNAILLIIIEWKTNVGILIATMIAGGIVLMFLPYSLLLIVLGGIAVWQLVMVSLISPVIYRRIVEPYENEKEK